MRTKEQAEQEEEGKEKAGMVACVGVSWSFMSVIAGSGKPIGSDGQQSRVRPAGSAFPAQPVRCLVGVGVGVGVFVFLFRVCDVKDVALVASEGSGKAEIRPECKKKEDHMGAFFFFCLFVRHRVGRRAGGQVVEKAVVAVPKGTRPRPHGARKISRMYID